MTRAPPAAWTKETTIPTTIPRERTRNLSASTVCSVGQPENELEQLKPLLDLIDLYYDGQKSLSKSPAVSRNSLEEWRKNEQIVCVKRTKYKKHFWHF